MKYMGFLGVLGVLLFTSTSYGFDFVVEQADSDLTIIRGSQGVNAVHLSLLKGPPQDVILSVSGLPLGTAAVFNSHASEPTTICTFDREGGSYPFASTFTLKITTSASTPVGSSSVQIIGTAGTIQRTSTFQFTVKLLSAPSGTIIYVDQSHPLGSDSNPGSTTLPLSTIQRGANIAGPGDIVYVKAGVYNESVVMNNSGLPDQPIMFLGEPGAIIDGSHIPVIPLGFPFPGVIDINDKHDITLSGFEVRNGPVQIYLHGQTETRNITIEHNSLIGGGFGIQVGSVYGGGHVIVNTHIRNNEITLNHSHKDIGHSTRRDGISISVFNGLRHNKTYGKTIRLNIVNVGEIYVYNNHIYKSGTGIQYLGESLTRPPGTVEIFNNYLHHNAVYNMYTFIKQGRGPAIFSVHDNILYEGTDVWRSDGTDADEIYIYRNRFWSLSPTVLATGSVLASNDLGITHSTASSYYIYHNSFNGLHGIQFRQCLVTPCAPNLKIINNIFSARLNFVTYPSQWPGWRPISQYMSNNYITTGGERVWDRVNPSFELPATHGAREIGIDLSEPWTLNGVNYPALPGMERGYFSGSAPDAGAINMGSEDNSLPAPTNLAFFPIPSLN